MSAPDPNGLGETLKRAADAATPHAVDVDAVLRASRARRRTRRSAIVGGVGAAAAVLVIGGGVMAGLQGLGGPTAAEAPTAFESAETSPDPAEEAGDAGAAEDLRFMAPEQVNRCGAPVAAPTDAATSPLTLTVEVPATLVQPGTTNPATIIVTNTGTEVVWASPCGTPVRVIFRCGGSRSHPASRPCSRARSRRGSAPRPTISAAASPRVFPGSNRVSTE
jgi:hypothetical protein